MSTKTVQLPGDLDGADLDREQAAREVSWPDAFNDSAVPFVDQLIEDNQELFDELACL